MQDRVYIFAKEFFLYTFFVYICTFCLHFVLQNILLRKTNKELAMNKKNALLPGIVALCAASIFCPFGVVAVPLYIIGVFFSMLHGTIFSSGALNLFTARIFEVVFRTLGAAEWQIIAFILVGIAIFSGLFFYREKGRIDFRAFFTAKKAFSIALGGGAAVVLGCFLCLTAGVIIDGVFF
jgi:hypothetical protein